MSTIKSKANIFAAIAFILISVFSCIGNLISFISSSIQVIDYIFDPIAIKLILNFIGSVAFQIIPLALGVILLIKKLPKWVVSIPLGIMLLGDIYNVTVGNISEIINLFNHFHPIRIIFFIFALIITVLALVKNLYAVAHSATSYFDKINLPIIRKLWFAPAVLIILAAVVGIISSIISFICYKYFDFYSLLTILGGLIMQVISVAGYAFLGLYFNNLIEDK